MQARSVDKGLMREADRGSGRLQASGGGVLSALAKIVMPEQAGGPGAARAARGAHGFEFFRCRTPAETFHFLHRGGQRQVTYRPDVRAAECAQQVDVGGPRADALEGD